MNIGSRRNSIEMNWKDKKHTGEIDISRPIVYCSGFEWTDVCPGRQILLMKALSAHTRIIILEPQANRIPKLNKNSWGVRIKPYAAQVSDNITVIHNCFAFRWKLRWQGNFWQAQARYWALLERALLMPLLHDLGVRDPIYWLSWTMNPRLDFGIPSDRLVYDCIDPCYLPEFQAGHDKLEFAIGRRAKIVFSTAETLLERMKQVNVNSYLLPNAASESYHPKFTKDLELPGLLRDRPKPIIGYLGTLDWRIDYKMLFEAAQQLSGFTFVLAGRVNQDQEKNFSPIRALPNVVAPGAVSMDEGRAYVAAFDVGLIPFLPGHIGDAINPVKMYMYLMAGKPVVSTWIRECCRHVPLVYATKDTAEFISAIRKAAGENDAAHIDKRIEFALQNTWEKRAQTAFSHLKANGLF